MPPKMRGSTSSPSVGSIPTARPTRNGLSWICARSSWIGWTALFPGPYGEYRDWLDRWVKLHGTTRAREIRSLDLEEWKVALAKKQLSPWTVNHGVIAVKTCWSWGVKNDPLPFNPLQKG